MARPESADCSDECPPRPSSFLHDDSTRQEWIRLEAVTTMPRIYPPGCIRRPVESPAGSIRKMNEMNRPLEPSGILGQADRNQRRFLALKAWREHTHRRFPNLLEGTTFIPPVHFNKVVYSNTSIGNEIIKIPRPDKQESDVRMDASHQRVHSALTSMFEGKPDEVMVVQCSVCFDNYLNAGGKSTAVMEKESCLDNYGKSTNTRKSKSRKYSPKTQPYSHHVEQSAGSGSIHTISRSTSQAGNSSEAGVRSSSSSHNLSIFRRPRDLPPHLQRGEVDVLIIHRDHGFVVMEIKALGDMLYLSKDESSVQQSICDKVRKSLKQLDKDVEVLKYLLEDAAVTVTRVLMLPNLDKHTVREALSRHPALSQAFCQCFDSPSLDEALRKCVFSDQLPPIGQGVTADDDVIKKLYCDWWLPLTRRDTNGLMNESLYESVIARFCGPATKQYVFTANNPRAEVSTLSQAVLETSRCFTAQVLTEQQVQMVGDSSPRVLLSGPPGTGKGVMVKVKVKQWLGQGHPVMIVSLSPSSHAVSHHLYAKVKQEVTSEQGELLDVVLNMKPQFDDIVTKLIKIRQRRKMSRVLVQENPSLESGHVQENPSLDSGFVDDFPMTDHTWDNEICEISARADHNSKERAGQKPTEFSDPVSRGQSTDYQPQSRSEDTTGQHQSRSEDTTGQRQKLHVIVHEAPFFLDRFITVLEKVLGKDGFVIWAATSLPCPQPSDFPCFEVTQNLHRPPAVVREMVKTPAYSLIKRVKYGSEDTSVVSSTPLPTDGPRVKRVEHDCHAAKDVWQCEQCGEAVATFLTRDLNMGNPTAEASAYSEARDDTLHFSDVLLSGCLPPLDTHGPWTSGGRDAPIHRMGQSMDAPIHRMGQSRDALIHGMGQSMDAPIHGIAQSRDAPTHGMGHSRDAPIHGMGQSRVAPTHGMCQSRDAPTHGMGQSRDAPIHGMGQSRVAPTHGMGFQPQHPGVSSTSAAKELCPLPGFLKGLQKRGVPFDVMVKDDVSSYNKLADPESDRVQIAEPDLLKGLERAVVVVLAPVDFPATVPRYVDPLYDVMGCCTSQLVIVGDAERILAKRLKRTSQDFSSEENYEWE